MKTQSVRFAKSNISYVKENLIDYIDSFLNNNQNTNDILVPECFSLNPTFDSKFAKTVFQHHPSVEFNLNLYRNQGLKYYGTTQFITIYNRNNKNLGKVIFANMICKRSNRIPRQLDYMALSRCLLDIGSYVRKNYKDESELKPIIACTKFGCGKSGGNWSFVEQLIQDTLDHYKIEVYTQNDSNINK